MEKTEIEEIDDSEKANIEGMSRIEEISRIQEIEARFDELYFTTPDHVRHTIRCLLDEVKRLSRERPYSIIIDEAVHLERIEKLEAVREAAEELLTDLPENERDRVRAVKLEEALAKLNGETE